MHLKGHEKMSTKNVCLEKVMESVKIFKNKKFSKCKNVVKVRTLILFGLFLYFWALLGSLQLWATFSLFLAKVQIMLKFLDSCKFLASDFL